MIIRDRLYVVIINRKKEIIMTIKEKAKELYPNPGYSACESYEDEAYRCGKISGFIEGAEWMQGKANEWIAAYFGENYAARFNEAMEE